MQKGTLRHEFEIFCTAEILEAAWTSIVNFCIFFCFKLINNFGNFEFKKSIKFNIEFWKIFIVICIRN